MCKKTILLILFLAGATVAARAQSDGLVLYRPAFDGQVIVAGAASTQPTPIVYTQPVEYDAPVVYNAPVAYNAPVLHNASVYYPSAPTADCQPSGYCPPIGVCAVPQCSTVQVIHFGGGQAAGQGYYFNSAR